MTSGPNNLSGGRGRSGPGGAGAQQGRDERLEKGPQCRSVCRNISGSSARPPATHPHGGQWLPTLPGTRLTSLLTDVQGEAWRERMCQCGCRHPASGMRETGRLGPGSLPSGQKRTCPWSLHSPRRAPVGAPLRPAEAASALCYPGGLPSTDGPTRTSTYARGIRSSKGKDQNKPAENKT